MLNLTANATTTYSFLPGLNLTFNCSANLSQMSITVAEFNISPLSTNFSLSGNTTNAFRYYTILPPQDVLSSLNKVSMTFTYNETDLSAQSITESNLRLFFYNTTSTLWQQEQTYSLDTDANILQVNITHLSTFVLGTATVSSGSG